MKGGLFGLSRYGMLRGKSGKTFLVQFARQIVQFGAIIFCRTFRNYFGQFVWIEKKSHYNSRVSLHEASTKNIRSSQFMGVRRKARQKKVKVEATLQCDLISLFRKFREAACDELCEFVEDIRENNGAEYPPKTICHILSLMCMTLKDEGIKINLFEDIDFLDLQKTVDVTSCRL